LRRTARVERIELDAAADATGLVGRDEGRARAKERVDDDVAAVGEIEKGVLAYMLKLRDRVVLETSIRDAMGKFDAPFGYAEGFDQTTGEYAGLIYAKAARKSSPRKGSLFAPTLRSSKCRACRPLRPVRSLEGTAPRVRSDLLPARQALRRLRRLRSSRAGSTAQSRST
jgi:hypothetical protein